MSRIFGLKKTPPPEPKSDPKNDAKNDAKNATVGSRRALLQDNSWIKNRPEEEQTKDENFGKVVLGSFDDVDSAKVIHNRYKSDDALDRIPSKPGIDSGKRSATLERLSTSTTLTDNSQETPQTKPWNTTSTTTTTNTKETKRQSWTPGNKTTTTTTTTTTTNGDESKRQSWNPSNRNLITTVETTETKAPTKTEGQKITIYSSDQNQSDIPRTNLIESARARFEKGDDKSPLTPPSPTKNFKPKVSPPTFPAPSNNDDKPKVLPPPTLPPPYAEGRPKVSPPPIPPSNRDEAPKVPPPPIPSNKDGKPKDSLPETLPPSPYKDGRMTYPPKPVVTENSERRSATDRKARSQDLNNLIEESNMSTVKTNQKDPDVGNLIEIGSAAGRNSKSQNFDNLIDVSTTPAVKTDKRDQDPFDSLIEIKGPAGKTTKRIDSLDDFLATVPSADKENKGDGTRTSSRTKDVTINKDPYSTTTTRTTRTVEYSYDTSEVPKPKTSYSYENGKGSSSSTTYSSPGITQSWSYEDKSQPRDRFDDIATSKSIKTVYAGADRSVSEKDMCTYCRKPLSIEAKMILNDMNINCHATCFKCEVCKSSLENLKAGDSMWIYKQTIHCKPCYLSTRNKWIR